MRRFLRFIAETLVSLLRPRADLVAENLALHQQVASCKYEQPRPYYPGT